MEQETFKILVQDIATSIYPKAKLKTAKALSLSEIEASERFEDKDAYVTFCKTIPEVYYFLVSESEADQILDRILQKVPKDILCYTSMPKSTEGDALDKKRIVFFNTNNPLDAIFFEGTYSYESACSNENIRSHFEELLQYYPIRIEDVGVNIVAGSIIETLTKANAKKLATLMFEMNPETVNFQSDEDDEEEEDLDYYDDADYFIKKLAKHLIAEKTFYYWWD